MPNCPVEAPSVTEAMIPSSDKPADTRSIGERQSSGGHEEPTTDLNAIQKNKWYVWQPLLEIFCLIPLTLMFILCFFCLSYLLLYLRKFQEMTLEKPLFLVVIFYLTKFQ